MKKIQSKLSVQNSLAQDALIAGVFEKIDNDFKETIKTGKLTPKPLMICSGGTSSRCTANGHWTLDLRRNYQQIDFDNCANSSTASRLRLPWPQINTPSWFS